MPLVGTDPLRGCFALRRSQVMVAVGALVATPSGPTGFLAGPEGWSVGAVMPVFGHGPPAVAA